MQMFMYVVKRILLMFLTLFIILSICFVLIKLLPLPELPMEENQREAILLRWEAMGYFKPVMVQYGIWLKNVFTKWDWGTSWYINYMKPVTEVIGSRLLPTVLVNLYSLIISIPIGIALGIFAALKKNKWQDYLVSTLIMIFVSVPSYVYAFLVQYIFYFKLNNMFPSIINSMSDCALPMIMSGFNLPNNIAQQIVPLVVERTSTSAASISRILQETLMRPEAEAIVIAEQILRRVNKLTIYLSSYMAKSMVLPVMALSFGTIAGLARFTRAELTEALTSEYMLLARTKGLTKGQATVRHAMNNAMVPILPSIISMFVGILGGSLIIEKIFGIPGVGDLYLRAINLRDYDVFMADTAFYTVISLAATIIIDLSYGFIDPRIRMGAKK